MKKILTVVSSFLIVGCSQPEPGVAITNVTVVDAINGVREDHTVVFSDDEIIYVGSNAAAPRVRDSIDGSGKYLIPGLWDMHVHLTYDERFTDLMPDAFLRYGITSVRDTGGLLHKLLPVVERMRSPSVLAPRVYYSGPLLDGDFVVYDGVSAPEIGTRNVNVDDAEATVAALKEAGASFIKIYEMVSPDMFAALSEAAERHKMPIAAHIPLAMRASEAARSIGSLEHLRNLELDCAANWETLQDTRTEMLRNEQAMSGMALRSSMHSQQRAAAIEAFDELRCVDVIASLRNTIQVPTAGLNTLIANPVWERPDWDDALSFMPQSVRDEWQTPPAWLPADRSKWDLTFPNYTMRMIRKMNDAGVPIGAGTDTPIGRAIPGYSLLHELEVLVAAGLTPLQAIGAATVQPAAFFSILDQTGSVDVGKDADLVLLAADPLQDIRNVRDIELVIVKGARVPR